MIISKAYTKNKKEEMKNLLDLLKEPFNDSYSDTVKKLANLMVSLIQQGYYIPQEDYEQLLYEKENWLNGNGKQLTEKDDVYIKYFNRK